MDNFYQEPPQSRLNHKVDGPMKWLIGLTLGAVIFALAFLWGRESERQFNQSGESTVSPSPVASLVPVSSVSPSASSSGSVDVTSVYTNSTYHFQLEPPPSWKGYTVKQESGTGEMLASYDFRMPTTDHDWKQQLSESEASLIKVTVYAPEVWKQISIQDGPQPTVLLQNSQYVVVYSVAQDVPADLIQAHQDTSQIPATAKFTS